MAIDDPQERCDFVDANCEPDAFVNFYHFYFCDFEKAFGTWKLVFWIPIGGFLLFVLMYNLGSTADEYLSPALESLSERFNISESLAGVTLLAFGNGAPDVFASIASASVTKYGID